MVDVQGLKPFLKLSCAMWVSDLRDWGMRFGERDLPRLKKPGRKILSRVWKVWIFRLSESALQALVIRADLSYLSWVLWRSGKFHPS